ncbi:dnaJ homolog subfamily C member 28 isoform X2 [Canis lupus familiaris]|uniref:dnaJ homolog subfamily C member 28 isoform X2 n=1 Tax=Canis lupus familiaris TaxID=9615 RepID=UPI0006B3D442|nr:dnaJ homolog subfamily C member 28 isoform X2 [Canis lupus familiaris]XP_038317774.1 dnaJ homolog subfamily C member 28 isoform X2 [Canis lupus familiaris]XP_038437324.1 dnaJ homolog subfamily C member 28 isoform X2 [Canis lupus familiaris]
MRRGAAWGWEPLSPFAAAGKLLEATCILGLRPLPLSSKPETAGHSLWVRPIAMTRCSLVERHMHPGSEASSLQP